jgi:ABC-type dipeptide/oligopeptide/nickel transport system permease subunit
MVIVVLAAIVAIAPGAVARYERDFRSPNIGQPPSWQHWLGTDDLGKDVYSRVCYGAQLSLLCGTLSVTLAIALGLPTGAAAGYYGGAVDTLLMRGIDVALAFPSVLVALLVAAAFRPGWATVIIAVGLINVPTIARQVRATVISVRYLDYVMASRALGATPLRTLVREILPSLAGPVGTLATLGIGTAILEVAALSFLGIGGDPTEPEWGSMLDQAKDYWSTNAWAALGPGLAISLTVLGFNLLGDALQDALDPTRYER